jgi:hypothetical protein
MAFIAIGAKRRHRAALDVLSAASIRRGPLHAMTVL